MDISKLKLIRNNFEDKLFGKIDLLEDNDKKKYVWKLINCQNEESFSSSKIHFEKIKNYNKKFFLIPIHQIFDN